MEIILSKFSINTNNFEISFEKIEQFSIEIKIVEKIREDEEFRKFSMNFLFF